MINNPKISIIIPTFNQGKFIEQTILSILNQTYKNFEIIIIDGGSKDNTIDIIKKHKTHLTYWISEKDSGQSEAINKGISKTTGDIITWLNSDDYYEPNTLETIANNFIQSDSLAVVHGKARLFGAKIKDKIIGLNSDIEMHQYLPFMRFPQPSSFYSKDAMLKLIPINEELHYAMDFEMIVKTVLLGSNIKRIDNLLSHYRIHENSKSNNDLSFLMEWTEVISRLFNSIPIGSFYNEELYQLSLIKSKSTLKYKIDIQLNSKNLEGIFLSNLNLHYHYHYKALNYSTCKIISAYLKTNYTTFYTENNYSKYNLRLKIIPIFIFKFLRKITR